MQKETSIQVCIESVLYDSGLLKDIEFHHPRIAACKNNIIKTHTIHPLIVLWRKQNISNLLGDDELFLREFLMLVYQYSGEVVIGISAIEDSDHARNITTHIVSMYEKLESLPIEELVNAMDVIAEELPYLLEKYEFNSELTWKTWFDKYWWVPPLIIVTLFLRIWVQHLLWKRMNQFQIYSAYYEEEHMAPHHNSYQNS